MRLNLSPQEERYELFPPRNPDDADDTGIVIWAAPALSDVVQDAIADDALMKFVGESPALSKSDKSGEAVITVEAMKSHGKFEILFAKSIARLTISRWEGVEDPDGSPAPVTADRIDAFLDHTAIYNRFKEVYLNRFLAVQTEKKGSALSPTGTSEGAQTTAKPARKSAKSAPKKRTARKR